MTDDYTPSLEGVRNAWASMAAAVRVSTRPTEEETAAEFDRMMAAHDEAVRAEEREKAAQIAEAEGRLRADAPVLQLAPVAAFFEIAARIREQGVGR